ncbi:hypothetical protein [Candidatus Kuenenia stuttgartiensis]|uniref:hypothetical protein n=1 Tax=Kuenenia stuttgartiensis TaxID=174633 RepID=UPI00146C732D|nr:hypothetical protein [Candidatus Kuenenia stuttgartiensis]
MFNMNDYCPPGKVHYEIGLKYFEKNIVDMALEHFLKAKNMIRTNFFEFLYNTML